MTTTMPSPHPESQCPYRGLIPYGEADAPFFFGRERWCQIILNNLSAAPLTLLYGPSGVGKSSVLQAGVVSRLKQQAKETGAEEGRSITLVIVCKDWRDDPLATLRQRIKRAFEEQIGQPLAEEEKEAKGEQEEDGQADLLTLLQNCGKALVRQDSDGSETPGKLLLILDQFEEYFLYHPYEAGANTFANQFPAAVNDGKLPLHVLISLREDSLAKLDRFKVQLPKLFANRLRIDHLDHEAAIEAILKPIEEFNRVLPDGVQKASVEPRLVHAVLEQVKVGQISAGEMEAPNQPATQATVSTDRRLIETPFLQLVMTRLWEEECRTSAPPHLRLDTLKRLGGAAAIVRDHLERLMRDLPEPEKKVAAIIFDKLVTPGLTKIAYPVFELTEESTEDRQDALVDRQDLQKLLDHLAGGNQRILRRVAPDPEQLEGGDRYEIFHDVLAKPILEWRRKYRQSQALEAEKQRHQAELEQERQRHEEKVAQETRKRRKLIGLMSGLGAWTFWLYKQKNELTAKENVLNVIEAAQQFKVKQLDEIDALVKALEAANKLEKSGGMNNPVVSRDVGASLRYILDHMQEQQRIQLLGRDDLTRDSVKMAKMLPQDNPARVVMLMRSGRVICRSLAGQSCPALKGLEQANSEQSSGQNSSTGVIETIAFSATGDRAATLSIKDNPKQGSSPQTDLGVVQIWPHTGQPPLLIQGAFSGKPPESRRLRHRLAISQDGQRIAIASFDGVLRIINVPQSAAAQATQQTKIQQIGTYPGLDLVRFSPNPRLLAIHDDKGIRLIDSATGQPWEGSGPNPLPAALAKDVSSLEFSPKRNMLAVASTKEDKVYLYSVQGKKRAEIDATRVEQLRFSPDGTQLAVGSRDASAKLWNISEPEKPVETTRVLNQAAVLELALSPAPKNQSIQNSAKALNTSGNELITFSASGTLHRWRLRQADRPSRSGSTAKLSSLAFNPRTKSMAWVASNSGEGCLLGQGKPWPTDTVWFAQCQPLQGSNNLARVQFQPDGILTGQRRGEQSSLVRWNREGKTFGNVFSLKGSSPPFSRLSFSPNRKIMALVAKGSATGALLLCRDQDAPGRQGTVPCQVVKGKTDDVSGVQFFNKPSAEQPGEMVLSLTDGRLCFVGRNQLTSFLSKSNKEQEKLEALGKKCVDKLRIDSGQGELAISSDDEWLGLAGVDGDLDLWQRKGNTYQKSRLSPIHVSTGKIQRVIFSEAWKDKRRFLATISLDGTVSLWNLKGQQLGRFSDEGKDGEGFMGAEFDREGRHLLLWRRNGSLLKKPVEDLPMLITRGCEWLKQYRQGLAKENQEDNQRLRFCDRRATHS